MSTMRGTGVLLAALVFSLSAAVQAEEKSLTFHPRSSLKPHALSPAEQPGPAIGYRSYMPPPAQSYDSGTRKRTSPPHRSHLHRHRSYISVVPVAPTWRVSFYPQALHTGQAMLQIFVTATEGELYLNDQYLGPIVNLQGRFVEIPILPGRHVVSLVHRGYTYPYAIDVEAGFTAVVQANLP